MKASSILVVVLMSIAGSVSAADFSDLQRATADKGKFDTGIAAFDLSNRNIPEPKAVAVETVSGKSDVFSLAGLPGKTVFAKLENLFKSAPPATGEDLRGWHSGRMVRDNMPNRVYGAVLLGGEKADGAGELTFRVMTHPSDTPDYFDSLDAGKSAFLHLKWLNVEGRRIYFPSAASNPNVQSFRKSHGCVIEAYGRENGVPYTYSYYCKTVKPALK